MVIGEPRGNGAAPGMGPAGCLSGNTRVSRYARDRLRAMILREPTYRPRHAKPEPPYRRAARSTLPRLVVSLAAALLPFPFSQLVEFAFDFLHALVDGMHSEQDSGR